MQIEVHDVKAHVTWPRPPDQCIHVRAIAVDQPTCLMDQRADLSDVVLEQPQRVRVGQHQACHVTGQQRLEVLDVHTATRIGLDGDGLVAAARRRGRVGPVRCFWAQNGVPTSLLVVIMVGLDQHQPE